MNDVKTLKIALVAVIAIGAVFGGVYAYRYQQLNSELAGFTEQIQAVKTESEAKVAITDFLASTSADTAASSASASLEGDTNSSDEHGVDNKTTPIKKCGFWCRQGRSLRKFIPFISSGSGGGSIDTTSPNSTGNTPYPAAFPNTTNSGSTPLNLEGAPGNANGNYNNYTPSQTQTPQSSTSTPTWLMGDANNYQGIN